MRKWRVPLLILAALLLYGYHILSSTGYFRVIEPVTPGEIVQKITLPGVEDIQISYRDSFMLLSSDDRASRRDGDTVQGHLYLVDLRVFPFEPIQLTSDLSIPFFPHGISMIALDSTTYQVYAVNHVGQQHSIEVFRLKGHSLAHVRSLTHESMISPNDIVALPDEQFYFTNDHGYTKGIGKLGEEYLGWAVSNVVFYDGENYQEVADGIAYANGINFDPLRKLLFVASPRGFKVKVYKHKEDKQLQFIEDIECGTGVDNIEFDESGKIWIGCHPSLLAFAAYAEGKKPYSPSEVITIDYHSKGSYDIEVVYADDGQQMAAATVAPIFGSYLFIGNVMDKHFLILEQAK